jgi:hypothetical protein
MRPSHAVPNVASSSSFASAGPCAARLALVAGLLTVLATAAIAAPSAGAQQTGGLTLRATSHATSQNWAGYAVTAASPFRRVLGSWVQPSPHCQRGTADFAAFWIGLGGFARNATGLEQIGTDADCAVNGQATFYAWYELLPAPPILVPVHVHPGDEIAASVTVSGHVAALHFRDLTTHKVFIKNVGAWQTDTSSAEWIAEAPSACTDSGFCRTLPLADFGSVTFSGAQAAVGSSSLEAVSSPEFLATELDLENRGGPGSGAPGNRALAEASGRASTSQLSSDGMSFSVTWEAARAARSRPLGRRSVATRSLSGLR